MPTTFLELVEHIIEQVARGNCDLEASTERGALLLSLSVPGMDSQKKARVMLVVDSSRRGEVTVVQPTEGGGRAAFGCAFEFWSR